MGDPVVAAAAASSDAESVRRRAGFESLAAFDAVFRVEHLVDAAGGSGATRPSGGSALPEGTPFSETVLALAEHGSVPVADRAGTVTRDTIDTLAFRAWLFGVLTFLETRARARIAEDTEWRTTLSEARLDKAREIRDERARRGRAVSTVDALQFGDVAWLAARYEGWYALFGVDSRRQARQLVRRLEVLRNGLAHGQEIVTHDWDTIVTVARSVAAIRRAEAAEAD